MTVRARHWKNKVIFRERKRTKAIVVMTWKWPHLCSSLLFFRYLLHLKGIWERTQGPVYTTRSHFLYLYAPLTISLLHLFWYLQAYDLIFPNWQRQQTFPPAQAVLFSLHMGKSWLLKAAETQQIWSGSTQRSSAAPAPRLIPDGLAM